MRNLVIAIAVAFMVAAPVAAASIFDCSGPKAACGAQELRDQGAAIDAELKRLMRGADPLTAMLLKRDQIWFEQIIGAENVGSSGRLDGVSTFLLAALKARREALARLRLGGATTPAGSWSNAFATATIDKAAGDALVITLQARLSYSEATRSEVTCMLTATAALGNGGWYVARVSDHADVAGRVEVISFRLQGNTLRVVHEDNLDAGSCTADAVAGGALSRSTDVLTGSYFPAGGTATAPAGAAARAVAPSFGCAQAEAADEQEICADPELARADVELAQLYRTTLHRLDPKLAAQLRSDQRAWLSDNAPSYLNYLQPGADKEQGSVHHTGSARRQLAMRQQERIALLANLDERRRGVEGRWIAHNASLLIGPAEGRSDGTMHAEGSKWDAEDYKSRCDFASDGQIESGVFKPTKDFPTLKRDGGTLLIAAEDPDKDADFFGRNGQLKKPAPDYCSRLRSPKARLFPVKPGSGIDAESGGLR